MRFSARYVDESGVVDLPALNYNDTNIPAEKPANEFRILSFGDSFAYSIMSYDYSYNGVAARMTNSEINHSVVRVINLGEPGTSVNGYMAAYQYWSSVLSPDAVIFNIYLGNDLLDIAFEYVPLKWTPNWINKDLEFRIADGSRGSHIPHKFPLRIWDYLYAYYLSYKYTSVSVPKIEMRVGDHLVVLDAKVEDPRYSIAATHNLIEDVYFDIYKTQMINFDFSRINELVPGYSAIYNFMCFVSELIKNGKKVLVLLAPNEIQVDNSLRQQLADRYRLDLSFYDPTLPARVILEIRNQVDSGIPVVDLTGYLQCRHEAGEKLYYKRNTHWNLAGNDLAGTVIASYMLKNWFHTQAVLPQAWEECCEEKNRKNQKINAERIQAFISSKQIPTLGVDAF